MVNAGAPLIGRRQELALLSSALDAAANGRGSMHVVAGEGGVGKTRLTAATQEVAQARGFSTALGRAFPVETGIPYALFADAFVPLLRGLAPAALQTLSRGATSELSLLFPVLRPEGGAAPRLGDTADLKPRLHDAFGQLLQRMSQKQPTLVVLENLQWADPSSFELLHFVGRKAAEHRVVLLCTYNDVQRDANPMLRDTERSLLGMGAMQRHVLPPFSLEETGELLERQFGVAPSAIGEFVASLHERTRGNPFFIEETMKALVTSGRLQRVGERWVGWETERLELPHSIRDALRSRYDRLSDIAQDVVIAAAVMGTQVPHALLEAVVPGDRRALLEAIEGLLRERILEEVSGAAEVHYAFSHPLMQEVLYAEISRARVRELHAIIADAMETLHGAQAMAHADQLAVHFLRAGSPAQSERACKYLTSAGQAALARGANREAAESLAAALAIAERGDDEAARDQLLDLLARARHRLGDYAGAAGLWSDALARALPVGDHKRIARLERQLGIAALRRGDASDALRHHDRGLDASRRAGDETLIASLRLARSTTLLEVGRGEEAEQDLHHALEAATRFGEPRLLSRVHQALQMMAIFRGPSADAQVHGERALALAVQAGEKHAEWAAHWGLAVQSGLNGNGAGTFAALGEAWRIARDLRSPLLRLWTAEVEIEYRSAIGEWNEALALIERTIIDARAFGQRALLPRLLVWSALIRLGRGEFEAGKAQADEAWVSSGADRAASGEAVSVHTVVPAHVARAYWHLYQAQYPQALAVAEAGLAIADRTGYTAWAMHRLVPVAAEASLWLRDWTRAQTYGARLRETSLRLGHPLGLAWADACDALKKMLADDRASAVAQMKSAADALDAIPFVEHAARLRRKLVDAMLAAGDRDGAMEQLYTIHATFERLGARIALEEVREAIRLNGGKLPKRQADPATAFALLTPREAEIARLVATNKSNKEIGRDLDISDRTVGTHLGKIFEKLGVPDRRALTDLVRAQGRQ